MKTQTPVRLSSIAPAGGELTPMDAIADTDLLLVSCIPAETKFGDGYRMGITSLDGQTTFEVLTTAVVLCKQLSTLMTDDSILPTIVNFTKQGPCWVIV